MPEIKGSCLCGAVTYEATGEPVFTGICHCRACQKGNGSSFNVVIGLPASNVTMTGTLSTFEGKADSGNASFRRFCPACGSPILSEAAIMPDMVMIAAGTLDDPSWLKPSVQIYCDSAQPWVDLNGTFVNFPKMPPVG